MNKLPVKSEAKLDSGWSLQLYSGDRRLLWSLDPSHGWTFFIGIVLGLSSALLLSAGYPEENTSAVDPVVDKTVTPMMQVD